MKSRRVFPDPRTLLYWNPTVVTKAGEATEIEFYASDVPGNYTVVVEGLAKRREGSQRRNGIFSVEES